MDETKGNGIHTGRYIRDFICALPIAIMGEWALSQNIENVMMLPDGNGEFTRKMGMLVERAGLGMGMRSWRYAFHAVNGQIKKMFVEPDFKDNPAGVPVEVSDAGTMLDYLRDR